MTTKHPIVPRYRSAFPKSEITHFIALRQFFHSTLGIPRCSWEHIVDELKNLKVSGCDFQTALQMYEHLREMKLSGDSTKDLK